jgi:arylformamidase
MDQLDFHSSKAENRLPMTHIEAPSYLVPDGKALNHFEPASFVRNAVLLDLTHMKPKQLVEDEDLEAAEEGAGLALREGEIVIIQTGWDRNVESDDYWSSHPALSENGAEYLEFKQVIGVGVDAPNVDFPGNRILPVHSILMRSGIFVIENLCNLSEIDQPRFQLIALPPRTKASVSTVRAVGVLESPD